MVDQKQVANGHHHQQQTKAAAESAGLAPPQQHNGERRMSAAAVFWSAGQQISLDSTDHVAQKDVNRAAGLSQQRPVLSTHVLDIATGKPAHGLHCKAYKWDRSHSEWSQIGETVSNAQGRIPAVHPGLTLSRGTYKLRFAVKEYFARQNLQTMFPHIDIIIDVDDPSTHLHVPLQLTLHGYSVYKGC